MFTDARVLIYTMEALGNFHIKRSIKSGAEHIFAFHGPYSTTMVHVKEAFDYYDTIFCIGSYQKEEIRKREQLYSLRSKNLVEIGYPYLDELASEYSRENSIVENNTVLIAPSWHEGNIFETCMIPIVKNLLKAGFKVIARPHDELLKRKPKIIYGIRDYFKSEQSFSVDLDLRNNNSVCSADILITDWSGISFEWALVRERPVLYINTKTKIKNSDYMELGITPIEIQTRNILGKSLDIECLDKIGECAKDLLRNRELYAEEIVKFREKNFYNWKNSAQAGGQYILAALDKDVKLDK
jgi:YidC/Oxa1 family membrane protein insertase